MANVLLLEPDRVLAETYERALTHHGHFVVPCASAQAAILAADQQSFDVVILELQLIEHSGIEFLYELRSYQEWQDTPVIIQSHIPLSEFAGNWRSLKRALGINVYMHKPTTSLKDLIRLVEQELRNSHEFASQ